MRKLGTYPREQFGIPQRFVRRVLQHARFDRITEGVKKGCKEFSGAIHPGHENQFCHTRACYPGRSTPGHRISHPWRLSRELVADVIQARSHRRFSFFVQCSVPDLKKWGERAEGFLL